MLTELSRQHIGKIGSERPGVKSTDFVVGGELMISKGLSVPDRASHSARYPKPYVADCLWSGRSLTPKAVYPAIGPWVQTKYKAAKERNRKVIDMKLGISTS